MKASRTFCIWLSILMTISSITYAQKLNSDPTFSAHNYKHPNKAKTPQAVKKNSNVDCQVPYVRPENYKASNLLFKRIPISVAGNFSWQKEEIQRNYKQSFRPRPRIDRDEQIRKFLQEISAKKEEDKTTNVESD